MRAGKVDTAQPIIYSGHGFSLVGEKDRFVLPALLRHPATISSGGRPIIYLAKHRQWDCLVGYGESRRTELMFDLEKRANLALEQGRDFDYETESQLIFGCEPVGFDGSGRFAVPVGLVGPGRVGDELLFQGSGKAFNLWNPQELMKMGPEFNTAKAMIEPLRAEALKARARKK